MSLGMMNGMGVDVPGGRGGAVGGPLGGAGGLAGASGLGAWGASSDLTVIADFYDPGTGGYAYRAFRQGVNIDRVYQIIRGPQGTTIGLTVYKGSMAWNAIDAAYLLQAARGQLKASNSIQSGIVGTAATYTNGTSTVKPVVPTTPRQGNTSSTSTMTGKANVANGTGGSATAPKWWEVAGQLLTAAAPIVQGVAGAIQTGGLGGSPQALAGQIAAKQQELSRTTDPVKRARLAAEIKQLQTQQASYNAAVAQVQNGTDATTQMQAPPSAGPTWLFPVVIIGGLLVVGSVVFASQRGKASRGRGMVVA